MKGLAHATVFACALFAWGLTEIARAQDDGATDAARVEDLPMRDSTLTFDQSVGATSFSRDSTLSYDPQYAWAFDLRLYWHFSEDTKLRAWQILEIELTDANDTRTRQKPLLTDTDLRLTHALVRQELSAGRALLVRGVAQANLPLSLTSQAAGMILGLGARLGADLTLDDVLHGATLSAELGYVHRFARANTVQADVPYPCLTEASLDSCDYLGSATTTRDRVEADLIGDFALTPKLHAVLWLRFDFARAHDLGMARITTDSGSVLSLPDQSTTHFRNTRRLYVELGYTLHPAVELSVSMLNRFAERDPDGSLRSPLRPVDTVLSLSATLHLDYAYAATEPR